MDTREIFSKSKFTDKQLINAAVNAFAVKEEDVLVVNKSDDWLKRNNRPIIFEFKAKLDSDDEEYPSYYYYDIFFDIPVLERLRNLKKYLNTEDLVVTQ